MTGPIPGTLWSNSGDDRGQVFNLAVLVLSMFFPLLRMLSQEIGLRSGYTLIASTRSPCALAAAH